MTLLPFSPASLEALGSKVMEPNRLLSHLLKEKPQVIALFSPLPLQNELEKCGYAVKVIDAKSVHLAHKNTEKCIAAWRDNCDFILIEALSSDAPYCTKLADCIIAPIDQELIPQIESAITKTLFIYEKENLSDGWSRFFGLTPVRGAASAGP